MNGTGKCKHRLKQNSIFKLEYGRNIRRFVHMVKCDSMKSSVLSLIEKKNEKKIGGTKQNGILKGNLRL
jgi:hypothetical protein